MAAKIVEIIDVQSLYGQQVLNVFHYVNPDGVASEDTLVADYINHVIPLVQIVQGPDLTHVAIRHRQVYPVDLLVAETAISPPLAGLRGSTETLASCDAISVKFNPGATVVLAGGFTGHIKRAGCRLAGPTEDEVQGNTLVSGIATEIQNWFNELKDPGTDAFLLCAASFLSGNPARPGVPSTRARQHTVQSYAIVTSQSNPVPSTQNTRKVIRGRAF